MKNKICILFFLIVALGCSNSKSKITNTDKQKLVVNDTVRITNEELEYEIIIIDPNFSNWLITQAKPRTYYSLNTLEVKNIFFTTEWNLRVGQSQRYNPNLYTFQIDYDRNIHYGFEVNYLLYNYFIYFQKENNQKL